MQPSTQTISGGSLTFADRAAYQRAIEEVYWRHRIWPKENSRSKPALDAMISQAQLQEKVEDYLHKSQLVAEKRGPITADDLQREIDRMARDTKQPELLRELFEALGNNPFVIAECLARPILLERLRFDSHLYDAPKSVRDNASKSPARASEPSACYTLPDVTARSGNMNDTWTAISPVPGPRFDHSAVWTGSEMIIWGGISYETGDLVNTGARYNPVTDTWTATSTINAPSARAYPSAVWTGSELIIWGGGSSGDYYSNTGARYNPSTDTWTATSTVNAPIGRHSHRAVWTGSEMIVWGGIDCNTSNCFTNTGARYNPGTDTWTAMTTTNAPFMRAGHAAVWTGSEMIVWGGISVTNTLPLHTGGKYNPATDSWTPTSLANVPLGRTYHTAIWTGSQMIVWGGVDENYHSTNTGGRYNPDTDSWAATSLVFAPTGGQTAVWTGSEMIIWGGNGNTGGRYNPATNSWTPTTTVNAPMVLMNYTAVWTGSEMIIWDGLLESYFDYFATGASYHAEPSVPIVQSAVSRKSHGNAGSFDVNLPLSGPSGIECRSGGAATGDYTIVVTFLANVSLTASPQAAVTSGVGTIGSGGVGNGGRVMTSGNVVTIPLTNVTNAQTINVTLNNVNGATNVTVPMRVLIGDVNRTAAVNASDVVDTKMCVGQAVSAANFRCDVNADGALTGTDVSQVKLNSGHGLP